MTRSVDCRHRLVALLALGALSFFATTPAAAQPPSRDDEPVVIVAGEGVVKAAPDVAWITLAVESRSKDPKAAQTQNAKAMAAVQQALAAAGVPKEAIRTLGYGLQLESDWVNGKQVPRGYVARNTIEVRVDDLARVGELIDVGIQHGANAVQGIRFDVRTRDALEREALTIATRDARARADAAAKGAGASIGRVVRIEEVTARTFSGAAPVFMARDAAQAETVPTPVIPGEIEIRAEVRLTATLR